MTSRECLYSGKKCIQLRKRTAVNEAGVRYGVLYAPEASALIHTLESTTSAGTETENL